MTRSPGGSVLQPDRLLLSCVPLLVVVAFAVVGAVWTPHDPLSIDIGSRLQPPNGRHWLGTDEFGRDVLSRIMAGGTSSMWISLQTVAGAITVGSLLGMVSGYLRGPVDVVLMVVNDALLAFPGILLALGLMTVLGAGRSGIVVALSIAFLPSVVRVVRGAVLSLRRREYVEASFVMGNSDLYSMWRHILPNCLPPIIILATSMFGWVLLAESALSFLGLGVPPPAPTWGNMLASGFAHISRASWLCVFPGLCISLTMLGINLIGDLLNDYLDPRTAQSSS